jgi:hypothetical protein
MTVLERTLEWYEAWMRDRCDAGIEVDPQEAAEQWQAARSTALRECAAGLTT